MPHADPTVRRQYLTKYARGWYQRNRDKELARQKAWRAANKDKLAANQKRYRSKPEAKAKAAAAMRLRRAADPERTSLVWRSNHYKYNYGITIEDFDRIYAAQAGRCAICGGDKPGGRWKRFAVDHCHASGKTRGLLCMTCNATLGHYERWYSKHKTAVDAYLAK